MEILIQGDLNTLLVLHSTRLELQSYRGGRLQALQISQVAIRQICLEDGTHFSVIARSNLLDQAVSSVTIIFT